MIPPLVYVSTASITQRALSVNPACLNTMETLLLEYPADVSYMTDYELIMHPFLAFLQSRM